MAIVQSSLDWKCDESFLVSVAGRKLANSYTKKIQVMRYVVN